MHPKQVFAASPSLILFLWHGKQEGHDVTPVGADPKGGRCRLGGLKEGASKSEAADKGSVLWDCSPLWQAGLWRKYLRTDSLGTHRVASYLQLWNVLALLAVQQSFLLIAPMGVRSADLIERLAQGARQGLVGPRQRQDSVIRLRRAVWKFQW